MLFSRLQEFPPKSSFLLGPRGTGKSTWLRSILPDAHTVDLLSAEVYQRLLVDPAQFANELRALADGQWVVVDEVQRLPELLNEVHRFIEEKRLRFILCGSSARKLRRAGVNLLAGRALNRQMHPFVPEELGERFDLDEAMRVGLLPIICMSEAKEETLTSYAQFYLREEIQAEALVRNLPAFARFLPVAAMLHGQGLNVTNVARETGVARTTAIGYLEILEETLLCFRLPAYEAKLRVRERKLPKWYWCDPGIVRSAKRSSGQVTPEERGPLFEGLVAQLIRAYRDYRGVCEDWYYWATASRTVEVDFLLRRGEEFLAIEVTAGTGFSESWCKGLRAVAELPGLTRRIVVYPRGPALLTSDGIEVLPFSAFSDELAGGTLWP
jgi:predicted AAA+ superfamily ATPase